MKYFVLRKVYQFLYWFGDKCGSAGESDIQYGYYRKYPKPSEVKDADLYAAIQNLGKGIETAS